MFDSPYVLLITEVYFENCFVDQSIKVYLEENNKKRQHMFLFHKSKLYTSVLDMLHHFKV